MRACVSPDVTVGEAEIGVVSGVDALVDVLRATMWAMDGTWLFMNNHLVEVGGDDGHGAELRVHHRAAARAPAAPGSWTEGARRFVDRLQRDGDGWRVVERRVETNMMPDDKVMQRPEGEQSIEAMTRRAEARARQQDD